MAAGSWQLAGINGDWQLATGGWLGFKILI